MLRSRFKSSRHLVPTGPRVLGRPAELCGLDRLFRPRGSFLSLYFDWVPLPRIPFAITNGVDCASVALRGSVFLPELSFESSHDFHRACELFYQDPFTRSGHSDLLMRVLMRLMAACPELPQGSLSHIS